MNNLEKRDRIICLEGYEYKRHHQNDTHNKRTE